jgi:NAD(P)-dependent dehydrogenase (short-subunit alcohol dehydrogenase family)
VKPRRCLCGGYARFGRPEDIAAAVTFPLSADGEWINGQVLPVNAAPAR